ncbi:MAG: hypothetical protein EXR50_02810 [Dehalococcoidia bacterium]|nr:hypothetical protein [Dehalococcoidia bacterium]
MNTSYITLEYIRAYYAALGFQLDDDELAAILPGVKAVFEGSQYLAELLGAGDEPATVFRPERIQDRAALDG